MRRAVVLVLLSCMILPAALAAGSNVPVTLKGSKGSMTRQNKVATDHGYTFAETGSDVEELAATGALVRLSGNRNYELRGGMRYPFARPEVRLFIERLAEQYRAATGEKLVVTSLTRPSSRQPKNAHALSVHPAGIAIDLRVSKKAASRQWLESTLLALERKGALDVTRERRPPHYHVALFPDEYRAYLEAVIGPEAVANALEPAPPEAEAPVPAVDSAAVSLTMAALTSATVPAQAGPRPSVLALIPLLLLALGALGYRRTRRPHPSERAW